MEGRITTFWFLLRRVVTESWWTTQLSEKQEKLLLLYTRTDARTHAHYGIRVLKSCDSWPDERNLRRHFSALWFRCYNPVTVILISCRYGNSRSVKWFRKASFPDHFCDCGDWDPSIEIKVLVLWDIVLCIQSIWPSRKSMKVGGKSKSLNSPQLSCVFVPIGQLPKFAAQSCCFSSSTSICVWSFVYLGWQFNTVFWVKHAEFSERLGDQSS